MEQETSKKSLNLADFKEIVKKAYDKGLNEADLKLASLMEELEADLKNILVD
ncbi:hypothetical protein HPT25_05545 [Bacillus sp. BRMEA1]|uniref:hypothetical protein n=1 Tax=Neobacillus endophyticus TaxID=2738405 RepID=UPI0015650DB0|nr:hypothetical protein [Neobacillus endophyticus]NRD76957.1 hypothetical protein [Neobacillus endophyticus]